MEALGLRRWRADVPLLITVTGTRGKTTLVRLVASVLRADGRRVLAKTTGSQASLILPDGTEEEVGRGRIPTILEQIGLLRRGAKLGVDAIVVEVMSIHAENHLVESRRILQPDLVLVTNFRDDHTEATGRAPEDVASLHLLDIPQKATVFIPEGEVGQSFREGVEAQGGELEVVSHADGRFEESHRFPELLDLVWAASSSLGVALETMEMGIQNTRGDLGELWVGRYGRGGEGAYVANAFAANDPESTALALHRIRGAVAGNREGGEDHSAGDGPLVGILNLRRDRGDRTRQWVEALEAGAMGELKQLLLVGFHGPAVLRRLEKGTWKGKVKILTEKDPGRAMETVLAEAPGPRPLIFGFGNMGGMGVELVKHWQSAGCPEEKVVHGT
jgi:poly-gamma-glutamate synthase PgsB/CapB